MADGYNRRQLLAIAYGLRAVVEARKASHNAVAASDLDRKGCCREESAICAGWAWGRALDALERCERLALAEQAEVARG